MSMLVRFLVLVSVCVASSDTSDFAALESNLCGNVVLQNTTSDTYIEANKLSNAYYDDVLSLGIIFCECENDVIESVNFIQSQQLFDSSLEFRVRSGGHSYGGYSKCENCIIVDTSRLNSISYDSVNQVIIAGPGVTGEELIDKLYEWNSDPNNFNILLPNPAAPTVSLGGYTIGGGVTFGARTFGLMGDYLIGARIALENGKLIEVNDDSDVNSLNGDNNSGSSSSSSDSSDSSDEDDYKEILYALRGGGITVGIVTQYTFKPIFLDGNPTSTFGVAESDIRIPLSFADGGAAAKSALRAYRQVVYCEPDENTDTSSSDSNDNNDDDDDECLLYNRREYSTTANFVFDFTLFSYVVNIGIFYYGTEFNTNETRDFTTIRFLNAIQDEMDINYTLISSKFTSIDYLSFVSESIAETAFQTSFAAAQIFPSRLIFDAKTSYSDDFISNLVDFHLFVAFNQFFQSSLLFVTINQNWFNGAFSENAKEKSRISYFPNRDADANIEVIILGLKTRYDTPDKIVNELKPILDSIGAQVGAIFDALGDQRYLNYISIFQESYLENFGRQDESENNEKIVEKIQQLKSKYDENDFFGFELSVPLE